MGICIPSFINFNLHHINTFSPSFSLSFILSLSLFLHHISCIGRTVIRVDCHRLGPFWLPVHGHLVSHLPFSHHRLDSALGTCQQKISALPFAPPLIILLPSHAAAASHRFSSGRCQILHQLPGSWSIRWKHGALRTVGEYKGKAKFGMRWARGGARTLPDFSIFLP